MKTLPRMTEGRQPLAPPPPADDSSAEALGTVLPVILIGLGLLAALAAVLYLVLTAPDGGVALGAALFGPHSFWYLTRASAFVAYGLLWWSMALGLAITNRMARAWPGGPTVSELHEHASLLGLGFGTLHAAVLLGDHYIGYTLSQLIIPFANTSYRPLWVGIGQIALYGLAAVTLSFYVRRWIGARVWRLIHYLSFGVFALALAHGVWSGSDSGSPLVSAMYLASAISLMALTIYRIIIALRPQRRAPQLRA